MNLCPRTSLGCSIPANFILCNWQPMLTFINISQAITLLFTYAGPTAFTGVQFVLSV